MGLEPIKLRFSTEDVCQFRHLDLMSTAGGIRTRIVSSVQDFKSCASRQFRHSRILYNQTEGGGLEPYPTLSGNCFQDSLFAIQIPSKNQ